MHHARGIALYDLDAPIAVDVGERRRRPKDLPHFRLPHDLAIAIETTERRRVVRHVRSIDER